MIADTNVAGLALVVAGAVLVIGFIAVLALRHRAKGSRARDPRDDASGPRRRTARVEPAAQAPGMGRRARHLLRPVVPPPVADRAGTEPQAGGGAQDRVDRPRREGRAPLHRGEPARRRLHALSRQRAAGRRDQRPRRQRQPDLRSTRPNLTTICGGPNTGHPRIFSVDDIYPGDLRRARRDAVVEHPLRRRARRPADQRPRAVPGRAELAERPVRRQRLPEQGGLRRGPGGAGPEHRPEGSRRWNSTPA